MLCNQCDKNNAVNGSRFLGLFVLFLVLDLLLLPKFMLSTPLSFFLLAFIVVFFSKIYLSSILNFISLVLILFLSVFYGDLVAGIHLQDNFKRAIQLCLIFLLVFLNYELIDPSFLVIWLRRVIAVFYAVSLFSLTIYYFQPDQFQSLISVIYVEATPMLQGNIDNGRFALHFTDPNSFGYLVVITLAFALALPIKLITKIGFFLCGLILVLSTQSRGAILVFCLVLFLFWLFYLPFRFKVYFLVITPFLLMGLLYSFSDFIFLTLDGLEQRREIEESMDSGIGGGRIKSWLYFLDTFNFNPFFGVGYTLERSGVIYRTHSDFIRLNLSYGFLIYIVFAAFFHDFRKRHMLLFVAFLIPFLINTVLDDYRLFGLVVVFFFILKYLDDCLVENN